MKPEDLKPWFPYIGGLFFGILLISVGYNWIMSLIIGIVLAAVFDYQLKKIQGGTLTHVEKERQAASPGSSSSR